MRHHVLSILVVPDRLIIGPDEQRISAPRIPQSCRPNYLDANLPRTRRVDRHGRNLQGLIRSPRDRSLAADGLRISPEPTVSSFQSVPLNMVVRRRVTRAFFHRTTFAFRMATPLDAADQPQRTVGTHLWLAHGWVEDKRICAPSPNASLQTFGGGARLFRKREWYPVGTQMRCSNVPKLICRHQTPLAPRCNTLNSCVSSRAL